MSVAENTVLTVLIYFMLLLLPLSPLPPPPLFLIALVFVVTPSFSSQFIRNPSGLLSGDCMCQRHVSTDNNMFHVMLIILITIKFR